MAKMKRRLWKPTKVVLWTGAAIAIILAILSGMAAMEHDPQGAYTGKNIIATYELVFFNAVALFSPFLAVAGLIELVRWVVRFARSSDRGD